MIALLSVFSQPEIIQNLLRKPGAGRATPALISRSDVSVAALRKSALFGLAKQMGEEIQGARGSALRHSASLPPKPGLLDEPEFQEPHRRGEVLVAAVMNGFLELRLGAFTEVLSVRPCVRKGSDGFTLRETVAEYYQVARLTPEELRRHEIDAPTGYLTELRKQQQEARAKRAKALAASDTPPGAAGAGGSPDPDDDATGGTTPLYGGGVLIFDEYGRLKYHIRNDVFGSQRQARRLRYLWESGQLEARPESARLRADRLSTIHRLRALDARRLPTQGW